MRTTVTLDADTAALVEQRMADRGVGFKQALNDLIRDGVRAWQVDYRTPTFDLGEPLVDITHALALAAELDDAHIAQKLQRGL